MFKVQKKHTFAFIGIALLIGAGASSYFIYPSPGSAELVDSNSKTYTSGRYGITFKYPQSFRIRQRELNTVDTISHEIVLNRISEPVPANGEEPPFISIAIYENEPEYASALDFIKGDRESNFQISDGHIASTTYGSLSGYEYAWSGLYEGKSFVVSRRGFIYMFSIAGNKEDPGLADDFGRIMRTVALAD